MEIEKSKPPGGLTIFILGLLGLLLCGILGIIAFFMGNEYKRKCREMGVEPEGIAVAGWVLGLICFIIIIVQIVVLIAIMSLIVAAPAPTPLP